MKIADIGPITDIPAVSEDDWKTGLDLGDGHYLRCVAVYGDEGELAGFIEQHPRPDNGEPCEGYVSVTGPEDEAWTVVQANPLTLSPSLQCTICDSHGHVVEGKWVPA